MDLVEALQSRLDEGFWVLNLETGEIEMGGGEFAVDSDEGEIDYEDPDRFMGIDPIPSHEAFQIMEDFAESLPDSEGKRSLERALGHSRPFRSFKDTLSDFLPLREAWFKFQGDRTLEFAQEWIDENVPGAMLSHK
jgi:hypothetical protein